MKIAVVGLGAEGIQVLWNLSNISGVEVHGFDSVYPGHPFGASGGESRLFRSFEIDDLDYVPIIQRADELWHNIETQSGQTLRNISGSLLMGDANGEQMIRARQSASESDVPHEFLDNRELAKRFPNIKTYPEDVGIWDSGGGTIFPELTISTTARLAQQNGAKIHPYSQITRITPDANGIILQNNGDSIQFDKVVVAVGGWTNNLFPFLKDTIVTKRLTSAWFHEAVPGYLDSIPPLMRTAPTYCYGLPTPGKASIKLGLGFNDHLASADPDTTPRRLEPQEIQEEMKKFEWILRDILPGLNANPVRVETYIESYSRTMREYVQLHPEDPRITILSGFSGHGFKVSPAIGEIGAQLAVHGEAWFDFSTFDDDEPVFEILDQATGATTYNPRLASQPRPASLR